MLLKNWIQKTEGGQNNARVQMVYSPAKFLVYFLRLLSFRWIVANQPPKFALYLNFNPRWEKLLIDLQQHFIWSLVLYFTDWSSFSIRYARSTFWCDWIKQVMRPPCVKGIFCPKKGQSKRKSGTPERGARWPRKAARRCRVQRCKKKYK